MPHLRSSLATPILAVFLLMGLSTLSVAEYVNAVTAARETIWKAVTTGKGSGATVAIIPCVPRVPRG